jgi:hypothetical protein
MRQVSPLPQPGITRRKNAAKKRLFANFVTSGNTSFIHPSARHRKKKKEKKKKRRKQTHYVADAAEAEALNPRSTSL